MALTQQVIRRVFQNEYRTRLDLQLARAQAFRAAVGRGERGNVAWYSVSLETVEAQQAYDAANIEGQIVRWIMHQTSDDNRVPSADLNE
jgi:hypothetical protein